ncbi:hypothetical protein PBAL39_19629 [Pedobacter sp. BAL39]|uniref:hypothetical protein n=1 Tax=Pedobacter sp. BAL39 TaxID=391596 RepID=UPI000155930B|nr:hypothetical protein [Pedobacter sp. BAL39]EDM36127.1 hypothetical protein PBAL39_19629 [Pedobacter sp. BAL39]
MAFQHFSDHTLRAAIAQLMSFSSFEICKYGMMVILEKEMTDLKGTVDPETFTGVEFDLLEASEDPLVKMLMKSVKAIDETIATYLMINSMDDFEVMNDDDANKLASHIFNNFISNWEEDGYENIVHGIHYMYLNLRFVMYSAAQLYIQEGAEMDAELYEERWNMDTLLSVVDDVEDFGDEKNLLQLFHLFEVFNAGYNGITHFF